MSQYWILVIYICQIIYSPKFLQYEIFFPTSDFRRLRLLSLFLLLFGLTFLSCNKKEIEEPIDNVVHQNKSIAAVSIQEARAIFNSKKAIERTDTIHIQGMEPLWDAAINSKYKGQFDILIVPVALDSNRLPGAGANLIFFRNQDSLMDYRMLIHVPRSDYWNSTGHRLNLQTFTGGVLIVAPNGQINRSSFFENGVFIETGSGSGILADESDWPWWWPWLDPCPNPNGSGGGGSSEFWDNLGNILSNIWDFLHAGSGSEGGLGNEDAFTDWTNYVIGFGNIYGGVSSGHNASGGNGSSGSLNNYFNLDLFTGMERKNAQMINQFKEKYCLSTSSTIIFDKIKAGCGFSDDSDELFFELKESLLKAPENLPDCAKNVIIGDRIEQIEAKYGMTFSETELLGMNGSLGCDFEEKEDVKNALISEFLENNPKISLTAQENTWLKDHFEAFANIQSFLIAKSSSGDAQQAVDLHIQLLVSNAEYSTKNINAGYPQIGTLQWSNTLNYNVEGSLAILWPNPLELVWSTIHMYEALLVQFNIGMARERQAFIYGPYGANVTWLGKGDAFLHTYWNALNAHAIGETLAIEVGNNHEFPRLPILHLEWEMDLFNNSIGRAISAEHPYPDGDLNTLVFYVESAIHQGRCVYLDPVDHEVSDAFNLGCPTCLNGILPTTITKPTNE